MPLFSGIVGSRSATLRVERGDEFDFHIWIWLLILEELYDVNLVFLDTDSQAV